MTPYCARSLIGRIARLIARLTSPRRARPSRAPAAATIARKRCAPADGQCTASARQRASRSASDAIWRRTPDQFADRGSSDATVVLRTPKGSSPEAVDACPLTKSTRVHYSGVERRQARCLIVVVAIGLAHHAVCSHDRRRENAISELRTTQSRGRERQRESAQDRDRTRYRPLARARRNDNQHPTPLGRDVAPRGFKPCGCPNPVAQRIGLRRFQAG